MPLSSMFVQNSVKLKLRAMSLTHLTSPPKPLSSIATAYRRLHNLYPQTDGNILLRGIAFNCSGSFHSPFPPSVVQRRNRIASSKLSLPRFYQQNIGYGRLYDEYVSDDEPEIGYQSSPKQLVGIHFFFLLSPGCITSIVGWWDFEVIKISDVQRVGILKNLVFFFFFFNIFSFSFPGSVIFC